MIGGLRSPENGGKINQLKSLDTQHKKMRNFDDDRPIVVFEHNKKLLVDGNHRVARWLATDAQKEHRVLLITLRADKNGSQQVRRAASNPADAVFEAAHAR